MRCKGSLPDGGVIQGAVHQMECADSVCWFWIYIEAKLASHSSRMKGEVEEVSLTSFQFAYARDTRDASNDWKKA
jgi:hypothetical protein